MAVGALGAVASAGFEPGPSVYLFGGAPAALAGANLFALAGGASPPIFYIFYIWVAWRPAKVPAL